MGTRADFYIGTRDFKQYEWLGSITWDGYPDGNPEPLFNKKPLILSPTKHFFKNMNEIKKECHDHYTEPEEGWPWPWETSKLTDYTYIFDIKTKKVYFSLYNDKSQKVWTTIDLYKKFKESDYEDYSVFNECVTITNWPDMSKLAMSDEEQLRRSGLILVSGKGFIATGKKK
jgi:hypothetical protein